MKTIIDDIINSCELGIYTFDNIEFFTAYPEVEPKFINPLVFIKEIVNVPYEPTYTMVENHSRLSYEIEIYSRKQAVGETIYSAAEVTQILGREINEELEALGLMRASTPVLVPYSTDNSIMRYVLTYSCVLDLKTNYIYGR